ncbi:hypothetical protein KCP76_24220 [Salmonella enterica subsp. enterica serovar Weltevreden]|nr:hypothetical protein KCP76_24220 [Salmonella enterica subsp. enterica serovar Weltevreden]
MKKAQREQNETSAAGRRRAMHGVYDVPSIKKPAEAQVRKWKRSARPAMLAHMS